MDNLKHKLPRGSIKGTINCPVCGQHLTYELDDSLTCSNNECELKKIERRF